MTLLRLTEVAGEFKDPQRTVYVNSDHIVRFYKGETYRSKSVIDALTSIVKTVTGDTMVVLETPEEIAELISEASRHVGVAV
jgi:hypothetical protein